MYVYMYVCMYVYVLAHTHTLDIGGVQLITTDRPVKVLDLNKKK